jgi:hypothetical protein
MNKLHGATELPDADLSGAATVYAGADDVHVDVGDKWFDAPRHEVRVDYRGFDIVADAIWKPLKQQGVLHDRFRARVRCAVESHFQFKAVPKKGKNKVFGGKDVRTGDPNIDNRLLVKSNQPRKLQMLFGSPQLRDATNKLLGADATLKLLCGRDKDDNSLVIGVLFSKMIHRDTLKLAIYWVEAVCDLLLGYQFASTPSSGCKLACSPTLGADFQRSYRVKHH